MGVEPKIGFFSPKMDGENNGTPYEQMDDLGGFPIIFGKIPKKQVLFPSALLQFLISQLQLRPGRAGSRPQQWPAQAQVMKVLVHDWYLNGIHGVLRLMAEILHHLGCRKPCK